MKDSIERFLKYDCPLGFPSNKLLVYCDFEAGGAFEDWGWVVEYDKKIIATDKLVECALQKARQYFAEAGK